MEFKINFAFIVCVIFVILLVVSLVDNIIKAIREKFKNKVDKLLLDNLSDTVAWFQGQFLIKEHGFTDEQLDGMSIINLCKQCGYKNKCASGCYPKCLEIDPELYSSIDSD